MIYNKIYFKWIIKNKKYQKALILLLKFAFGAKFYNLLKFKGFV